MLTVEKIDTPAKAQIRRFVRFPFRLYQDIPQWVPPIRIDAEAQLNRDKHPFFEHSDGDFFIAVQDGQDVGRLAVFENRRFNQHRGTRQAQFYFFDCIDDQEVAAALFERAFEWALSRGLDTVVGPKGMGPADGYGMLVEGFEQRQMMTMMSYNFPYYPRLVEGLGFVKEVDFVSCYLNSDMFTFPERLQRIAERVQKRGTLNVKRFRDKRELLNWAKPIGQAYNQAFVNNWEYYPLTEREITFAVDNLLTIANHRLIKVITHQDTPVGFLFGFPDVSAAIQRSKGRLLPFGILDIMRELRRTKWIALNGAGILPEHQGHGGNALLYTEMGKTVQDSGFEHAELVQVAETAVTMRQDMLSVGAKPYKNHRVYIKHL